MEELSQQDLEELDDAIDAAIPSFRLLRRDRDLALIHLLHQFEKYVTLDVARAKGGNLDEALARACGGLDFSITWIFQHGQAGTEAEARLALEDGLRDAEIQDEAREFLAGAEGYSDVWDLMSMLRRRLAVAHRADVGIVNLVFREPLDQEMDMAARLIGRTNPPGHVAGGPAMRRVQDIVLRDVEARINDGLVTYHVSDDTFAEAAEAIEAATRHRWELSPEWDLGGYTIAEFHRFWLTLHTLTGIHRMVYFVGDSRIPKRSPVATRPRELWVRELAQGSELSAETVSRIIDDLTYQPALYQRGNRPIAIYQPFIPIDNLLSVSPFLVDFANAERNTWHLISMTRRDLHDDLKNKKEGQWIAELTPRLEEYGLSIYPPRAFNHEGKKGNMDLLVLDTQARFGLVCELKWLILPGSIKQSVYNDREFNKGIRQAELATEWARSVPPELSQHTGLSADELRPYDLRPIVLSKLALPTAWLRKSGVPVINERLVDWILGEPHGASLEALWRVGEELRYLPRKGIHFEDAEGYVEFGGIRFTGEPIGFTLGKEWDPRTDIQVPE
jgi:hypothetical protein